MTETLPTTNTAERIKAELLAMARRVSAPSSNKISTKGKLFSLPDGKSSPGPLNVVILDFVAVNSFYEGIYNPQNKAPPACFAVGTDLDAMVPSASAPKPQGMNCNDCIKNSWGSGQGGRGKACKNTRRLIVVPPDFTKDTVPMTLYISPTGLKGWDAYIRRIVVEHTSRPIDVVTTISFDPNQAYPSLQFGFGELNPNVAIAEYLRTLHAEMLNREPEAQAKAA